MGVSRVPKVLRVPELRCDRLLLAAVAMVLFLAACSEPATDDAGNNQDDSTDVPATGSDDADDTGNEDTDDADASTAAAPAAPGESNAPADTGTTAAPATPGPSDDGSIVWQHRGEPWFLGTIPSAAVAADMSAEPIKIGMINQEDTPIGSFPEVRFAAEAAINWINAELGGVDGRPLEFHWCITPFSPEQSQVCAQEMVQEGVVALVGGINVMSQAAFPILEQNGIPVVGGIPAGLTEQRSASSFTFSGGSSGGLAAFMKHAADNGADKAVIAYGEFDAFEVAAADYGAVVGEYLGLDVKLVRFPVIAADFLPVLNQAIEFEADAVVIAAADSSCVSIMKTFKELEIDAQLYLVGACAADHVIEAADGANIGVVFNSEGPPNDVDVEGTLFDEATNRYNTGPAQAAGTVGFRGMMNLYGVLVELGGDHITSEAIIDQLRQSVDHESFWGHPYTCDGQQVPGLPALCAPQQTLFKMESVGEVEYVSGWIDTAELFAASGAGQ
ncbi:MAG: ABC transporter substrate-binding protein [Acidimicrobiaceae bacterium]|nr:ABC transporter substrate-binding protein [Acidimicrobiaceae bacterium]MYG54814.1 ABC transporter substrate-binding protein [Acidimicrobiaceae bacterium]MYJ99212.1 ABC transporter substrate-binding protein [Acidimicrobiaceae bacterium]